MHDGDTDVWTYTVLMRQRRTTTTDSDDDDNMHNNDDDDNNPVWGVESCSLPVGVPIQTQLSRLYVVQTPHLHGAPTTGETSLVELGYLCWQWKFSKKKEAKQLKNEWMTNEKNKIFWDQLKEKMKENKKWLVGRQCPREIFEYFHMFLPRARNGHRFPGFVFVANKSTKKTVKISSFFCNQRLDDIRNVTFFRRKPATTTDEKKRKRRRKTCPPRLQHEIFTQENRHFLQ